ncbi:glycosyltransferase family 4 protein [soil metagenome]
MKNSIKQTLTKLILNIIDIFPFLLGIILIPIGLICSWLAMLMPNRRKKPRLLWASSPIKSLAYMACALKEAGYKSETVVLESSAICTRNDFDHVLMPFQPKNRFTVLLAWLLTNFRAYIFFARTLVHFDIFHFYFDGGILRRTLLARFELCLLRLAGKRIVLMPYGSDAFVYDLIPNPIWRHALLTHYPMHGDAAAQIQKRIRRMTAKADTVVGCLVHIVNLPRWDILPLTCYPIDTQHIQPSLPKTTGPIRIAHAPNHRGIKGTEYLLAAIHRLQQEGHDIELDIIEKLPNTIALQRINQADIFVDQLVFGYALAALEGFAMGKIVITAIEDTPMYELFRRYSYLNECPAIAANTMSIYVVLKDLIARRRQWPMIGAASRTYAERRHSYKATAEMFEAIYKKIWYGDENIDLINFYHPLLEKKVR